MDKGKKASKSMGEPIIKDDEIDLIEIGKTIWAGRKLILKITLAFFLIGVFVAFGSKVEYEAKCKLLPENQEGIMPSNLGGLGSLAGLAGINLDMGNSETLKPEMYPEIAQSLPFLLKVINEPIHFESLDKTMTSYNYFKEIDRPSIVSSLLKYTLGLPSQIKKWMRSENPSESIKAGGSKNGIVKINFDDNEIVEKFQERLQVEVDSKSGIIEIAAEMPDALASAELTKRCVDILTEFITEYKTSKAKVNFDFIVARYEEAKTEFEKNQANLARFNDRNRNVVTALGQVEMQQLENDYNISFEVYKGLATQMEQAKIKVKEETPVFTYLEPVKVPVEKSAPKRVLILIVGIFIGLVTGCGVLLFNKWLISLHNN